VRINGLDSPYWYRDVVDLLEQASERLDIIMIPKVGNAADIYAVDALVTSIEAAMGRTEEDRFRGHHRKRRRHRPRRRNRRRQPAHAGHEPWRGRFRGLDGDADHRHRRDAGKLLHAARGPEAYSDPWHWAQAAIVSACRTHGVLPVDGPFGDFSDDEGYRAQARRSATLGMVGKWAIHPKQVALANEVFTPSEARP
jgi:malyl-CoA/(S)-citramalyl-CoA lyase